MMLVSSATHRDRLKFGAVANTTQPHLAALRLIGQCGRNDRNENMDVVRYKFLLRNRIRSGIQFVYKQHFRSEIVTYIVWVTKLVWTLLH